MAYVLQQAPPNLDTDGVRKYTEEQLREVARAWAGTVARSGDTMTGTLTVSSGNIVVSSGGVFASPAIGFQNNGELLFGPTHYAYLLRGIVGGVASTLQAIHEPSVWAGWQMELLSGNVMQFRNDGSTWKTVGSTLWQILSDARIKDVSGSYGSGLEAIVALNPVRYRYKGNCSFASTGVEEQQKAVPGLSDGGQKEYVGLVAQEAEKVMPELFTRQRGVVDGVEVDDLRGADYSSLIFALVNAVKELKARVEELEGAK